MLCPGTFLDMVRSIPREDKKPTQEEVDAAWQSER